MILHKFAVYLKKKMMNSFATEEFILTWFYTLHTSALINFITMEFNFMYFSSLYQRDSASLYFAISF